MANVRPLLFALLPLFAGCQLFQVYVPTTPSKPPVRLQGELALQQDRLLLRPCGEQRRLELVGEKNRELRREVDSLLADGQSSLFVDLSGRPQGSQQADLDGAVSLEQVYRVQGEGPGCNEPGFDRLLLRANGHEPDWTLGVGDQGLVLLRPSEEPLALPYLEEQLPDGSFSLSSEADGRRLELWLTPQRCVDSMSGAVQHLSAELRLDGTMLQGCASYGGARSR